MRDVVQPELTWSDEFDGEPGDAPDPVRWNRNTGGTGWGNHELEYYTDQRANAFLDGSGHLVIRALPDDGTYPCWYGPSRYTSARLFTRDKFTQTCGRFEARMLLPRGIGLWPAFWLYAADDSGEIDVIEHVGDEPNAVYGSVHGAHGFSTNGCYTFGSHNALSTRFHTFAVDWGPDAIRFSVDGIGYRTVTRAEAGDAWVFDRPFYLIVNLAVGGDWPGPPDDTTRFPANLLVDYVRVYRDPVLG